MQLYRLGIKIIKVVFAPNWQAKKDNEVKELNYIVLAATNCQLSPQKIIKLYARRWQIEIYFKAAKQYLALDKTQIQSYDGQCGYLASRGIAYDLLASRQQESSSDTTLGDIFYEVGQTLTAFKFWQALVYIIEQVKKLHLPQQKKLNKIFRQGLNFLEQKLTGKAKEFT